MSHADYREPSDNDEFEYVEVWEQISTGLYHLWDKKGLEFRILPIDEDETFIKAAYRFERKKVEEEDTVQGQIMLAAIGANNKHRRRLTSLIGDVLSSILGG